MRASRIRDITGMIPAAQDRDNAELYAGCCVEFRIGSFLSAWYHRARAKNGLDEALPKSPRRGRAFSQQGAMKTSALLVVFLLLPAPAAAAELRELRELR